MLTLHHLETSRSQRVLWLLEELNLPYALQTYPRDAKTRLAPPALKRVHPLGLSPILCDRGLVIAESGAIIEYLAERYGAWAPPDMAYLEPPRGSAEHLQCRYWMHFACSWCSTASRPSLCRCWCAPLWDRCCAPCASRCTNS